MSKLSFPNNFLWGAATASHQVEGNCRNNWSEWESSPARLLVLEKSGQLEKHGKENFISGAACDHYNRYKEDFALAKSLGHNATRISLEWSRIEPQKGIFDEKAIAHYQDVIKTLHDLNITPFVTLFHWTLPLWLAHEGGFESKHIVEYFSRYTQKITEAVPNVKFWITLNEPEIFSGNSYLQGIWPPQKRNFFSYLKVVHHLIAAHKSAYKVIKSINTEAQVAISKNNIYFEASQNKIINVVCKKLADYCWNNYFLKRIKKHQDFIGLNYYFHNRMDGLRVKNENKRTSDMGWELYPQGIYHVLKDLRKYGIPVYITENGLADSTDTQRQWFIEQSLQAVHQAIREGVDIRGYLHWSLMDNFEWDKGFWPRFGLIEIDFATLERKPRPSAYYYRDICLNNFLETK